MSHHASDGSASRTRRALINEYGRTTPEAAAGLVGSAQAQAARCEQGEHVEAVAERGHVTRLAFGVLIEPGTRYCRYCSASLGAS